MGRKPRSLDFPAAAALPLTSITAWEAMFDRLDVARPVPGTTRAILIVGGAGGVGSIAIQLARQLTDLAVKFGIIRKIRPIHFAAIVWRFCVYFVADWLWIG